MAIQKTLLMEDKKAEEQKKVQPVTEDKKKDAPKEKKPKQPKPPKEVKKKKEEPKVAPKVFSRPL